MQQIQPYSEIKSVCEVCSRSQSYKSHLFTPEALEYLNAKSIGLLYSKFRCDICEETVTLYSDEELLFDKQNLKFCQIGAHPIPNPQLEIDPGRKNCVHCDQKNEDEVSIPPLVPRLINSQPCPKCTAKMREDPKTYAHRTGTTEIRLNSTTLEVYVCCTLYPRFNLGGCSHARGIEEGDEIENIEINAYLGFDVELFAEEEVTANTLNIDREKNSNNSEKDDLLEKIENKFEELKKLMKKLREMNKNVPD